MSLAVNLRHLELDNVRLEGEVEVEELDIDARDEVIQVAGPVEYSLEIKTIKGRLNYRRRAS